MRRNRRNRRSHGVPTKSRILLKAERFRSRQARFRGVALRRRVARVGKRSRTLMRKWLHDGARLQ